MRQDGRGQDGNRVGASQPSPGDCVPALFFVVAAVDEHVLAAAEARVLTEAGFAPRMRGLAALFAQGDEWAEVLAEPAAAVVFFPVSRDEQVACAALADLLAASGHRGPRLSAQSLFWPSPTHALAHAHGLAGGVLLRPTSALVAVMLALAAGQHPIALPGVAWRMPPPEPGPGQGGGEIVYWPVEPSEPPPPPAPLGAPQFMGLRAAPVLLSAACTGGCPGCPAGEAEARGWSDPLWRRGIAES